MQETLYCIAGNHHYERERKRGRKPTSCPEHSGERVAPQPSQTPQDEEAEAKARAERTAKARAVKEQRAQERRVEQARAERESDIKSKAELDVRISKLQKTYDKALAKAARSREDNMKAAFDEADVAMTRLMGASRLLRQVDARLAVPLN